MASPNDKINAIPQTTVAALGGAPKDSKTAKPKQTVEEMEIEIRAIELESKKLELETKQFEHESQQLTLRHKKAQLQDLEDNLADRELKRENNRAKAKVNGATIDQIAKSDAATQKRCNHKKGGNGAAGVVGGRGDSSDYAVIKHMFAHGDTWILCTRCGKTWKPPVESDYADTAAFEHAKTIYETALDFQTKNVTSKGVVFKFSDNGDNYRKQTAQVKMK